MLQIINLVNIVQHFSYSLYKLHDKVWLLSISSNKYCICKILDVPEYCTFDLFERDNFVGYYENFFEQNLFQSYLCFEASVWLVEVAHKSYLADMIMCKQKTMSFPDDNVQ